ncbi:PD-(D/E)XK nuclease family protein [Desertivirga arenae]|uniref:PD-(D/E)XK nuclease family protein n=1 Tax=Desertivirga arenae TaxID=2810309 RepID=UPI001A978871|nr:PD-(D/E)XK nuclease family protein [Pedobacter sp. SYSU D00823]
MKSFLQEVAADLLARFNDDLQDVAIVFNNKRPGLFLKKHLGELAGKSLWSPAFFTVGEFFAKSSNLVVADQFTQFFVLHKEYNRILKEEGKEEISPDKFYSMAEIILGDFSQIDYDLVNAEDLFCQLEDIAVIQQQFPHFNPEQYQFLEQFWSSFSKEKQQSFQQKFIDLWKRMPDLYKAFHEELKKAGYATIPALYRNLAESESSEFVNQFKKVVFVGFNALNRAEVKLFKHWQEIEKALFYFDTDSYYLDDVLQEAGLFIRRNLSESGLINALGESPNLIKSEGRKIQVIQTHGHASQAKAISQFENIKTSLAAANDPEKTAIIIADESLLLPVLQTIPSDTAKVNVTMGFPLAQSTVFGLIDLWLSIQEQVHKERKDSIYYKDVLAFLSHPLTGVQDREKDILQKRMLENQWVEVPLTELHFSSLLAPNFFTVKHAGLQTIDALYVLLTAVLEQRQKQGLLQQLEANLLMAVSKELNLLFDGLSTYQDNLPLTFALSLIRKALQGLSVPLEGEPLRGIQVMGLLESRCLDFENVIILGVNEGTLPKLSTSPSFIPDSIRRVHGLPVLENQDAIAAYLFYRLLQRSTNISFIYNSLIDESNSGEPSRFLRQLEFESGFTFKYYLQNQPVQIESAKDLVVEKKGKVWSSLQKFLQSKGNWDDEKISATALTTYLNCSLQFFFKYVAKIKEPEEITENLEANQVGSVLHQVMEWYYEDLSKGQKAITAEDIKKKRSEVPQLCKQALSMVLFGNKTKLRSANSMQQIILRIVEEYVDAILSHDENVAPFAIIELENKKDYKLRFPISIKDREHQVLLYGIIDRVDRRDGTIRIVDYKTGSDEVKYSDLDALFERDGDRQNKAMIQTLFYTYIYEQVKQVEKVEPNLYIIRKMKNDGTLFFSGGRNGKAFLQAEHLEDIKSGFYTKLRELLEELFNPEIPFAQTSRAANCGYCAYKEMCGR